MLGGVKLGGVVGVPILLLVVVVDEYDGSIIVSAATLNKVAHTRCIFALEYRGLEFKSIKIVHIVPVHLDPGVNAGGRRGGGTLLGGRTGLGAATGGGGIATAGR